MNDLDYNQKTLKLRKEYERVLVSRGSKLGSYHSSASTASLQQAGQTLQFRNSKGTILTEKLYLDLQRPFRKNKDLLNSEKYAYLLRSRQIDFPEYLKQVENITYHRPVTSLTINQRRKKLTSPNLFSKIVPNTPTNTQTKISTDRFRSRQIRMHSENLKLTSQSRRSADIVALQMQPKLMPLSNQILKLLDKQVSDRQLDSDQLESLCKVFKPNQLGFCTKYQNLLRPRDAEESNKDFGNIKEYIEDKKFLHPVVKAQEYKSVNETYKVSMREKLGKQSLEAPDVSPFQEKLNEVKQRDILLAQHEPVTFYSLMRENDQNDQNIQPVKQITAQELDFIQQRLDPLLERWAKEVSVERPKQDSENVEQEWAGFALVFKENCNKNFVRQNLDHHITPSQVIRNLDTGNPLLYLQNIPSLMIQNRFSRYEVHNMYTLYKALQMITSQRYKNYKMEDGLDFETFRAGIPQVYIQSEELARSIFNIIDSNFSGFLNWNEFYELMSIIRAKTICEKVDLFIKVADEDGNGLLSWNEIIKLCKISLMRFLPKENDKILGTLSHYFSQLIFQILGQDYDSEISFKDIKQAILDEKVGWQYLCLFCGADT